MAIDFEILKENCRKNGIDHEGEIIPDDFLNEEELQERIYIYDQVLNIATRNLATFIQELDDDIPLIAFVEDAEGFILKIHKSKSIVETFHKKYEWSKNVVEGARFVDGFYNSANLVLRYREPVQVIGDQHYHKCLHNIASFSVPIFDRKNNRFVGVLSIGANIDDPAKHMYLPMLKGIAASIEAEIDMVANNNRLAKMNELLVNTTNDGILMFDKNKRIIEFNNAAEKLLNIERKKVMGIDLDANNPKKFNFNAVLEGKVTYSNYEVSHFITRQPNEKPEAIYLSVDILPIELNGDIIGGVIQLKNVTESKVATEHLRRSKELALKAKKEMEEAKQKTDETNLKLNSFLYTMGHELRQPLNQMGYLPLLQMSATLTDKELEYVNAVAEGYERMCELVEEILNHAVLESKNFAIELSPLDIRTPFTQVLEEFDLYYHDYDVEIKNRHEIFDINLPEINGNSYAIHQILFNILSNAATYSSKTRAGVINIDFNVNDKYLNVIITDNGIGIPDEEIKKIFGSFYRAENSSNVIVGAGLGLSITKNLLNTLGGLIDADSKEGLGSKFIVSFPLANQKTK